MRPGRRPQYKGGHALDARFYHTVDPRIIEQQIDLWSRRVEENEAHPGEYEHSLEACREYLANWIAKRIEL